MENWLIYSFLALMFYGLWAFFPKLAVSHMEPLSALVYEVVGSLAVGLAGLYLLKFNPETDTKGILYSFLTGVFGMLGTFFFFGAAKYGKISIVVSLTALYPLIAILLAAIFLKEPVTARQVAGICFALLAILCFST